MKFLGNLIWFVFGGFFNFIGWSIVGLLWCVSIIGIPVGVQCFKFARLSLFPFGKQVSYGSKPSSILFNLLWLLFGGIELAVVHLLSAVALTVTIIGIPFAVQQLKFVKLSLMPFGSNIS